MFSLGAGVVTHVDALGWLRVEVQGDPERLGQLHRFLKQDADPSLTAAFEEPVRGGLGVEDFLAIVAQEGDFKILVRRLRQAVARAVNAQSAHLGHALG